MPIDRKPEFFKGAQLKVAIIGCGYVGLPLALRFAEAGHKVTGFDTDPNKINMLNAGRSYIEHTAISIQPNLQKGQLVVLESTTYPGTTEELVLPILEKSGLRCPIAAGLENDNAACDFWLAFSPEREDPGNKQFGLAQIPKVVGGVNPPSGRAAQSLYAQ